MNTLGKEGEEVALAFLKAKGYTVLEKNYRKPFGEIDIIAKDKECIVFIEVKTRADLEFGHPFEAVDYRKREKIKKVALSFIKRMKEEPQARFDVLSISRAGGKYDIRHIKDAFEV